MKRKSKSSPSKSYREKLRTVDQAKKDYSRRLLSAQSTHKKKSSPPTSSSNHPLLFQRAVERSLELIQAALADPNGTSYSKVESIYRKLCWVISKHRQAGQINLSETHKYLERLGPALKSGPDSSLKRTIPADVERELKEWIRFLERRPSLPLQPAPSAEHSVLLGDFTSDASATGVGITYDSQFYGFWRVRPGFWNQINQNIAVLELIGVEMLVRSIVSMGQRNVTVSCRCDNTAVCDLLEPGRRETPRLDNPFMRSAFDRLRQLLEINSIQIQCTWIPTEINLSDHISRGRPTDMTRLPSYASIEVPEGLMQAEVIGKEEVKSEKKRRVKEIQSQMRAMRATTRPQFTASSSRLLLTTPRKSPIRNRSLINGMFNTASTSRFGGNRNGNSSRTKIVVDLTQDSDEDEEIQDRSGDQNRPVDLTMDSEEEEERSPLRKKGKGKDKGKGKAKEIVDLTESFDNSPSLTDDDEEDFFSC